jgi:hypothetical protein
VSEKEDTMSEKKFVHVDDDDAVGYGKPPKHRRFKAGKSGNPSGKKHRIEYEEDDHPLRRYMLELRAVASNGKKIEMPAVDIMIKNMVSKALGGCYKTQKLLIQESGGLTALREEYKHQKSQADREFIDAVLKKANKWYEPDVPTKKKT